MKKIYFIILFLGSAFFTPSYAQWDPHYCDIPNPNQTCDKNSDCLPGEICAGGGAISESGEQAPAMCVKFDPSNPEERGQCIPSSSTQNPNNKHQSKCLNGQKFIDGECRDCGDTKLVNPLNKLWYEITKSYKPTPKQKMPSIPSYPDSFSPITANLLDVILQFFKFKKY